MVHLHDWLTTEQIPFASKLTNTLDHYVHDHDFFEIFYLIDGSITHFLNGEETVLNAGDILFLNPEDVHAFYREEGNDCTHRDIIIRKELFVEACNYISPNFFNDYFNNRISKKAKLSSAKIEGLEQLLSSVSSLPKTQTNSIMMLVKIVLAELLGLLVINMSETNTRYPEWIQEILENFNNPKLIKAGLGAILSNSFYTKEHICRVFKKHFGMTLTEYLNKQRLDLAASLLTYSDKSVLSISMELGFSSVSYFNKIFKKRYKLSPLSFRKNHFVK